MTDRSTWSPRTAFWIVLATQVVLLAGSNFPTPLFPLYARQYGFGSGMVTALFAVYVVALIPSMLTLGRATDRIGRRPTLVVGMAVSILSSLVFASAHGLVWLFAGEVVYGIAAGMVMSAAPVAIRELHPRADVAAGALAATLAFAAGLTAGPLVSGLLADVTPWPTVAPFALHIALAALLTVLLVRIPETKPLVARAATRPPVLHVPSEIRAEFAANAIAGATPWMAAGWIFALSPSFLHEELGVQLTRPAVSGLFAALVVATNGITQLAFRRHHASIVVRRTAMAATVVGIGLIAGSTLVGALPVAVLGGLLAGGGSGIVQMSTMATVQAIAPDHARGGVTSAFLTTGYLALSVPVVVAGVTADRFGLAPVTGWYLLALAVLVGAAVATSRTRAGQVLDAEVELPVPAAA